MGGYINITKIRIFIIFTEYDYNIKELLSLIENKIMFSSFYFLNLVIFSDLLKCMFSVYLYLSKIFHILATFMTKMSYSNVRNVLSVFKIEQETTKLTFND